ncbi:TadE/TadG family type IV pilus assembly protein [Alkaliphilus serpentinus]|uniref:Pilus assembly protein n=1 Tax=Alkaliphilus serpentinus TaxID=1482731 RepID=A0A833HR55_9FIRM|nr:TadE family protein [Alkaliphilus serpentinus]KAB3532806.1 pilus assembly protein [Alkaliphilus serpentinus]
MKKDWITKHFIYIDKTSTRGSITVEAALIFPLVFCVIVFTMYIVFFLYQYAYLQASANYIAGKTASQWKYLLEDTTVEDIQESAPLIYHRPSLYWRLYDFTKNAKVNLMTQYNDLEINKHRLISKASGENFPVIFQNSLLSNRIIVSYEEVYKTPIDAITNLLGVNNLFKIQIKAQSTINDPAEGIRNMDFALDMLQKNERAKDLHDQYFERVEAVKDDVKEFLNSN